MKKTFAILGATWALWITVAYFIHHPQHTALLTSWSWVITTVTIIALIYTAYSLYTLWYRGMDAVSFTVRPWHLLLGCIVGTVLVVEIIVFSRGAAGDIPFVALGWKVAKNMTILLLVMLTVLHIVTAFGLWAIRLWKLTASAGVQHLISAAIGILVLQMALFSLALGGTYNRWALLGVLLLMLVISLNDALQLFVRYHTTVWRWTAKVWSLDTLLMPLAVLTIGLNFVHILRPIPNGWDEFVRYINTPHLLAEYGSLLTGVHAYPQELIMSMGYVLMGSLPLTLGFSVIMGVLVAGGIYVAAQSFMTARMSLRMACMFLLIPFVIFQSSREVKVDLATTFFAIAALIAFLEFRRALLLRWIALAGLLVGAAFAIKYTSLFFVIALGAGVVITIVHHDHAKQRLRHSIYALLVFVVCSAIPYLPWGIYFTASAQTISTESLMHGPLPGPQAVCTVPMTATPLDTASASPATGNYEELGRYLGYTEGPLRYVLAPWTVTMNTVVNNQNVDVGFLLLALIPPLLIAAYMTGNRPRYLLIGTITGVFWLLWLAFAQGVIWYGMPGIALLLIMLGMLLEEQMPTMLHRVAQGLVVLFVIFVGCIRISGTPVTMQLQYVSGGIPLHTYVDTIIPGYRAIAQTINADVPLPGEPKYVYRIGSFIPFFITDNHRRLFTDDQMNVLSCLREGRTDAELVAELKAQGFKYMILDLGIPSIDRTAEASLAHKWEATAAFINNNLRIIVREQRPNSTTNIVLAELP